MSYLSYLNGFWNARQVATQLCSIFSFKHTWLNGTDTSFLPILSYIYIYICSCWSILFTSALCGHRIQPRRPPKSNGWLGWIAGVGNSVLSIGLDGDDNIYIYIYIYIGIFNAKVHLLLPAAIVFYSYAFRSECFTSDFWWTLLLEEGSCDNKCRHVKAFTPIFMKVISNSKRSGNIYRTTYNYGKVSFKHSPYLFFSFLSFFNSYSKLSYFSLIIILKVITGEKLTANQLYFRHSPLVSRIIIIIITILLLWEFFVPSLADGFLVEFEWQQVSSSHQDSA